MVTGDNQATAEALADDLDIALDRVIAGMINLSSSFIIIIYHYHHPYHLQHPYHHPSHHHHHHQLLIDLSV